MDAVQQYKSFLSGRYLSEGIRTTIGIVLPSVVMNALGHLPIGITLSIASLAVSITDVPGPAKHRVNGMAICVLVITVMAALTGIALPFTYLLGILIVFAGFIFSMLPVYGMRSSALGVAALYTMVINLDANLSSGTLWRHVSCYFAGGLWYFLYSLLLTRIKPFKIIQQVVGDFIISISDYLLKRGDFYQPSPDFDKIYQQLFQQQVEIEKQQALAAELIYKTRGVVRETSHTARILVKMYLDSSDILESIMTTYQAYQTLHKDFGNFGILEEIRALVLTLSNELHEAGIAVKAGQRSEPSPLVKQQVTKLREHFEKLRQTEMNGSRMESFLGLGRIIQNLEDLAAKTETLHHQTSYDKKIRGSKLSESLPGSLAKSEDIRLSIFVDNLNLKSHTFKHAIRVAVSLLAGYLIIKGFDIAHGNWILLTVIVILKPSFSMTRQRNKDRLFGTVIGVVMGVLILHFIKNDSVLLALMIVFMLGSFIWIRTNYFLAVVLLTPELIILYHLLIPGDISDVLTDRIVDTSIGSAIAFLSSFLVAPVWEYSNMRNHMVEMIRNNLSYYRTVAGSFTSSETDLPGIRKKRREVLLSLSNLSDAFHRMLTEPKRFQKDMDKLHRFVVLNYSITSHLATLSYYLHQGRSSFRSTALQPLINHTIAQLETSEKYIRKQIEDLPNAKPAPVLEEYTDALLAKRKKEIEAGMLETETKKELIAVKSVVDQLMYIQNLAETLAKLCREY